MIAIDRAGAELIIDLAAVRQNYARLVDRVGDGVTVGAVIKADSYGLGAARVGPVLQNAGCGDFFVATLDEAIGLREILPDVRVYVLNGAMPGTEDEFHQYGLRPVLNDLGQVDRWAAWARAATTAGGAAAIHIDTGMSRLGLPAAEFDLLVQSPGRLAGLEPTLWISHLACAEEADHPMNAAQRDLFVAACRRLSTVVKIDSRTSLSNSSGVFLGADYHFDLIRAGVALYGVNPTPATANPMAQVIHLQGKIVQVRDVDSPMTVGYGAAHRVTRKGRIATVPVGYADGYLRSLSDRGMAVIAGHDVPIAGRVSMDLITLDVSDLPDHLATVGTPVELIGAHATLDDVAAAAGTIAYELLTRLSTRIPRQYRDTADP